MALAYERDDGIGGGVRLGLIVLSTDETLENEARGLLARTPVSLLHARIPAQAHVTPDALATMADSLPRTAALLPPDMRVIAYACTSGATVIGPDRVAALIGTVHPGVAVTDPLTAVTQALAALKARRIALLSPYVASITKPLRARLAARGIETVHEASFVRSDDHEVARIAESSTREAMMDIAKTTRCDAIFASCTNLRTFGIIDEVEAATGCPVITSNQALLWAMLGLAGIAAPAEAPGRLFDQPLTPLS